MIKQITYKTFSIILAFLLVFSTVSFTVEKHFCGNTLIDVSLFTQAEKCKMEVPENDQSAKLGKSCCKDTIDVVEGQDELNFNSEFELISNSKILAPKFDFTYLNLYVDLPKQIIPHKDYSPPNLIIDIHIFNQVFVI